MPSQPPPSLVIRADASKTIGGGHVTRCLSLADELRRRGWRCALMTGAETAATVALPDWLEEVPDAADLLIVDHYGLAAPWESGCRSWARRILVVDDLADRTHECDLLLDQAAGRREEDYRPLVPPACRLLLGPSYAILRPEFVTGPKRPACPGRRLLINFGAADPQNIAGLVLRALAATGERFDADVVCGASTEHIPALQAIARQSDGEVTIHGQVANMAELMAKADLAIGAGGSASWERCALGLPSIVLTLADNQSWTARALAEAGAALNPAVADAAREALALLGAPDRLSIMSAKAAALCDGRGAERVADIIESQG
ncbi:MAG TPA: UDP-2,4-diacetamido-2,4,6-trideoxy-beta-L-altropyranose hydrolase [Magnetospirillaceae bacterium]|nr:UDP-2,4-diacetamido-2,4,6-trideoxy-beta-L-altropyranose hydrolase [Magnetospirillaceae bacterium]